MFEAGILGTLEDMCYSTRNAIYDTIHSNTGGKTTKSVADIDADMKFKVDSALYQHLFWDFGYSFAESFDLLLKNLSDNDEMMKVLTEAKRKSSDFDSCVKDAVRVQLENYVPAELIELKAEAFLKEANRLLADIPYRDRDNDIYECMMRENKETFELLKKIEAGEITEKDLIGKEINIKLNVDDILKTLSTEPSSVPVSEKTGTERISIKDALCSTPIGKKLFTELNEAGEPIDGAVNPA